MPRAIIPCWTASPAPSKALPGLTGHNCKPSENRLAGGGSLFLPSRHGGGCHWHGSAFAPLAWCGELNPHFLFEASKRKRPFTVKRKDAFAANSASLGCLFACCGSCWLEMPTESGSLLPSALHRSDGTSLSPQVELRQKSGWSRVIYPPCPAAATLARQQNGCPGSA